MRTGQSKRFLRQLREKYKLGEFKKPHIRCKGTKRKSGPRSGKTGKGGTHPKACVPLPDFAGFSTTW
jgi:hypothetical protein